MTAYGRVRISILSSSLQEELFARERFHPGAEIDPPAGTRPQFYKLNNAICNLIDEWNMVQFLPLNPKDMDSLDIILQQVSGYYLPTEDIRYTNSKRENVWSLAQPTCSGGQCNSIP